MSVYSVISTFDSEDEARRLASAEWKKGLRTMVVPVRFAEQYIGREIRIANRFAVCVEKGDARER